MTLKEAMAIIAWEHSPEYHGLGGYGCQIARVGRKHVAVARVDPDDGNGGMEPILDVFTNAQAIKIARAMKADQQAAAEEG